jgi:hypothetical protein
MKLSGRLSWAVLVATIAALAWAGAAQATPGIDAWWGNTTATGQTKGGLFANGVRGVAMNATSGQVYVADTANNRIQRFDPALSAFDPSKWFVAAWGKDVDATAVGTGYEICLAPVGAEADHCKKAATSTTGLGGELSSPEGIAIDQAGGNVYVTDAGNRRVQELSAAGTFIRAFGKDTIQSGKPGDTGTGFEICEVAADCKAGVSSAEGGALGTPGYLTVAPAGAPNAGDVLVADPGNLRVAEYKANGEFVRAFGWDVAEAGPGNIGTGFEVCNQTAGDTCKAGSSGAGAGQFASGPTRVAEDKTGRIYTVEPEGNFRVQRFTLPGNVPMPQGEFAAAALHGSINSTSLKKNNTTEIGVDDAGEVYAVKAFPVGTGTPAVTTPPGAEAEWQQRILALDPTSEAVDEVIAANPGFVAAAAFENLKGLAVGPTGTPLYATTPGASFNGEARVFRLNEIAGLGATVEAAGEVGASTAKLKATITPAAIPLGSAYHFEYSSDGVTWTTVPVPDAEIGNASAGGESSSCSPAAPAASCHVAQNIAGLTPNVTYQVRLSLHTLFNVGGGQTIAGPDFTTKPAAPVTITGAAHWSSPAPTNPSLSLGGTVNPGHGVSTYFFQYVEDATFQADKGSGDGFQHAGAVPAVPASAGHGLGDVSVHETIAGLDPTKTYHYRLVASNPVGTKEGAERSIAPPSGGNRFFERVSEGDSWGSGVEADIGALADSGDRAMFAAQAFGQPESLPGLATPFVSERGASGWKVAEMVPDRERASRGLTSEARVAADLGKLVWAESSVGERERSEAQFGFAGIDGSLSAASPQLAPLERSGHGFYNFKGASGDLSTIVFNFGVGESSSVRLLGEETLLSPGNSNLYEVRGAGDPSPEVVLLNRSGGKAGPILGGACGAGVGGAVKSEVAIATHAVSADGSVVYFSAYPGAPAAGSKCEAQGPKRLYKRINGESTLQVSAPQCTPVATCPGGPDGDDAYKGASVDGDTVFFTTVRRLVNADTDSTADLYAYDATPPAGQPNLVQVSAGETVGAHTAGQNAKVLGVLDNSGDGSRVYFVAEGALTGANLLGKTPVAGAKNLYAYERDAAHPTGRIAFVGGLVAGDQNEWEAEGKYSSALPVSESGGDGHFLVFVTAAKLLPAADNTDSAKDLYRYDDSATEAGKALECLSCAGGGSFDVRVALRTVDKESLPDPAQQSRVASADVGTVMFTTQEKLLPSDENETWDAYIWQEGTLSLLSAGTEGFGVAGSFHASAISPDGRDAMFVTRAPLVGADTNNALDLYDARIGGGFPEAAQAEPCESEAACHPLPPPPPPPPPATGSEASGEGNPPAPKPCKKGFVRKGGKCVKKHASKHNKHGKKHHKRAGQTRGTGR